ncbi:MAG: hypothetical protein PHW74_07480 [Desulfobacca sp.]|nr:hypothetical protein [Desulfobacca sp.]
MAEIKSALELALEKAERLGRATEQEMQEAQDRDWGRHLAADFLRDKVELEEELQKVPAKSQALVMTNIKEVLLRNITLSRQGGPDPTFPRVQSGLLQVAQNKKAMQRLLNEVAQLLKNFEQVRQKSYEQLKASFAAGLDNIQRAMAAQMHMKVKIDVEHTPQFQEEWNKFESNLVNQFEPRLEQYKAQMLVL